MPPAIIPPNPQNASLDELDAAARCAVSLREHGRLFAVKALILQVPQPTVAELCGVSLRTLRRWTANFNRAGIDGLLDCVRSGRPPAIPPEQRARCAEAIEHPECAGRTHWTGVKFHGWLRDELQIEAGYSTVIRFLHEQGFALKVPQPWSDRQDEALREEFRVRLREWLCDERVELWFADESGFEGDPRPRRRWAKKGSKLRVVKNGDHVRMNVCGMIAPRTGQAYLLEFTHSDTDTFQAFLDHADADVRFERPRNLLILDNASWHKTKRLEWGRFEPVYLPPYSPDLNPIERLWLLIKAEWFNGHVSKNRAELIERLDQALNWAIGRAELNKKTCGIRT